MITRYRVSFEDRLIEPDSYGKWVKFEEYESACMEAEIKGTESSQEAMSLQKSQIESQSEQIKQLMEAKALLDAELQEGSHNYDHYKRLLNVARDRLKLLGHHPNCSSRYTATNGSGTATVPECNCGLDEWMRESGLNG